MYPAEFIKSATIIHNTVKKTFEKMIMIVNKTFDLEDVSTTLVKLNYITAYVINS